MMTAMVIAMLVAITAWWFLIQRLKEKPWLQQGVLPTSGDTMPSAPRVGLWLFLAVVTSLFGLFASAYTMRMGHHGGGLTDWQRLDEPGILWLNTLVLLFASGAMQIARSRSERGDLSGARAHFTGAGLLTLVFLLGQALAWRIVVQTSSLGPDDPAFSFFVLLTAVHGLHLLGGLVVLGRTATRIWRGVGDSPIAIDRVRMSVQLCTLYWHWLLLIWLGVFALLLTT